MKIISNKLYEGYTKTTIDYHTEYSKITKEQLYDTFKFHCQGQRLLSEVVDYIYDLIQKDNSKSNDNPLKGVFANVNDDMLLRNCGNLHAENEQLKSVIKEIRECIEELYDNTDDTTCYDIDKHRKEYLLQILDKGENDGTNNNN